MLRKTLNIEKRRKLGVKIFSNRFVASLAITALTVTAGLTPVVAMASERNVKSAYNVLTTQNLINALTRLGGFDRYDTAIQIADNGWQSASTAALAPSGDLNMVDDPYGREYRQR